MMRICSSLTEAGFDVLLIGRKSKSSQELQEKNYRQKRTFCFFNKGKLFYIEYQIRLFFILLFTKTDIYCAIDTDTLLANTFVSIIKSRKLAFDAHEYFTEVPELTNRKWSKMMWGLVEKICLPQTQLRYTVSQSLADIFSTIFNKPFHVIRNVPSENTNKIAIKPNDVFTLIYQGDLNEGRGIEIVLKAIVDLPVQLIVAGDGPLRNEIEILIKQLNITDKVNMLGYVSPDELRDITSNAHVGLNLLENKGLSYYYSLSNKFFNYIQAGIPQICANFPEYQLINQQYKVALLCDYDVNQVKESIGILMNNTHLYNDIKNSCSNASAVFTWQHEEQQLIHLYRELSA